MSSVIIAGDTSGSVTLQAPATAGSTVINLPSTLGSAGTSSFVTSDSSGNIGIGTTTPYAKIQATGTIKVATGNAQGILALGEANGTSVNCGIWRGAANAPTTDGNYLNFGGYDGLVFATGNAAIGSQTERMRINSSGTTTFSGDVTIADTKSLFMATGSEQKIFAGGVSENTYLTFSQWKGAAYTERARIDSSGSLLVGTTSNSGYGGLITASAATSSFNLMTLRDTGTTYGSGQVYALFQNSGGSTAGSIQHTASTTVNYSTSSDARLKTSLGVATDTSVIDNTVIHDFQWIEDGRIDRGVFAQEANEVKPSAVSIGKDDLTEDGNLITPWGVDYSKFVPDLIVHAQQLKKQVQELKAEIDILKGNQ